MSPGMRRAREPFRIKNAITGVLLAAFGVGVWAYSISAVKQDIFDDVDEEAKELAAARRRSLAQQGGTKAGEPAAS
jgi:cytochrome c oxidase assembly factor 3